MEAIECCAVGPSLNHRWACLTPLCFALSIVGCKTGSVGFAGAGDGAAGAFAGATGSGGDSSSGAGGGTSTGTGGFSGDGGAGDGASDAGPADGPPNTDAGSEGSGKIGPPFVGVGGALLRAYTTDGKQWTSSGDPMSLPSAFTNPVTGDNKWLLRGVCYGAGRFVAVGGTGGEQGLVLTATDGMNWSVVGGIQTNDACAYGNGVFVTNSRWSPDGVNWTRATQVAPACRQIVFGNGVFVSFGDQGTGAVSYTRDGKTWTALDTTYVGTNSDRRGYTMAAFGNSHFLAMSSRSDAPIFEWDGASETSFTETPLPPELQGEARYAIAFGRGAFYIAGFNAIYRRDEATKAWTKIEGQGARDITTLTVTDDIFLDWRWWSTDGVHWTAATMPPPDSIARVTGATQ